MKIHEAEAQLLIGSYGVPVNPGEATDDPVEAARIGARIGWPVVLKAQVLTGGRGKAGGVRKAGSPAQAEEAARAILGMTIKGDRVSRVLVARAVDIEREHYLGITVDRARRRVVIVGSASGGVDIEELASREPGRIVTLPVDPLGGPAEGELDDLCRRVVAEGLGAGEAAPLVAQARDALRGLFALFREKDCSLVEVNPYALLGGGGGRLVALDTKVVFDDNALFRHPDIEALRPADDESPAETEARRAGLAFVGLEGEIGCIVNGAGLAMATMDLIGLAGGRPANFLDVGGSSNPDKVLAALRIVLANRRVRAVLVNIFGGITRCDDVAHGILMARRELGAPVPLVVRLIGTNEQAGRALLAAEGLTAFESLSDAVAAAVRLSRGAA